MTQIGEMVSVIIPGGTEQCIFCKRGHQKDKPAPAHTFQRSSAGMSKLKKEGRAWSIDKYSAYYPAEDLPPLTEWGKDITKTGGYKAAAHHCIALKCASQHEVSGELKEAGYDPNRGRNCSWLPYSKVQFSRARAYDKALQKHRGGHTGAYFKKVDQHLNNVADLVEEKFCTDEKKASKEALLNFVGVQEDAIWNGLASVCMTAYQLYNDSFLNPGAAWGAFEYEVGKTKELVRGSPSPIADDDAAEAESADDPE